MSLKELKIELKGLASSIKSTKIDLKDFQRKNGGYSGKYNLELKQLKYEYRHKHIAYCQLRGRKYEEIERKCSRAGDPNKSYIQEIMDEHKTTAVEDVRACA